MSLEALKVELWKKVKGNETIEKASHHYQDIRDAIFDSTGYNLSRDTIRNLFEDRNRPSPQTRDIYATFILGGTKDTPNTMRDFQKWFEQNQKLAEESQIIDVKPKWKRLPSKTTLNWIATATSTLVLGFFLWLSLSPTNNKIPVWNDFYFLDTFLVEDVNSLLDNDWQILDPDQEYLDTLAVVRHEEDYLHLYTLAGDYWDAWGGAHERLKISNLFVHEIECECCIITTKIDSFFPNEAHQQAGIFLFDDLDKDNFIRITYKYREKETEFPNTPWIQVIQMNNRKMTDLGGAHFLRVRLDKEPLPNSIGLKLEIAEDKIIISYNYDDKGFLYVFELTPFLDINYVGLGAFKGNNSQAEIIPVRFDFIEVAGCDAEY